MTSPRRSLAAVATALLALPGCGEEPVTPIAPAVERIGAEPLAARSADRCVNVHFELDGQLGLWAFNGVPVPGAAPTPVSLAGLEGVIASVLTEDVTTHGRSQTVHWVLHHVFVAGEPSTLDLGGGFVIPALDLAEYDSWFITDDKAVCAAGGGGAARCRVNDRLTVVEGAGVFENAGGFLHNHGWITITDPQTGAGVGEFEARGRVCGDGLVD